MKKELGDGSSRLKIHGSTSINYDSRVLKKPPMQGSSMVPRPKRSHKTLSVTEPTLSLASADEEKKKKVQK